MVSPRSARAESPVMNVRSLLLPIALVAGLACTSASAVTWVAPRDFAAPVRDVPPVTLSRTPPAAAITLKLTVAAAGQAECPRHLADHAAPPVDNPVDDAAPVRHDSDTAELPAELAKR
jgi:hypothetical protein